MSDTRTHPATHSHTPFAARGASAAPHQHTLTKCTTYSPGAPLVKRARQAWSRSDEMSPSVPQRCTQRRFSSRLQYSVRYCILYSFILVILLDTTLRAPRPHRSVRDPLRRLPYRACSEASVRAGSTNSDPATHLTHWRTHTHGHARHHTPSPVSLTGHPNFVHSFRTEGT